MIDERLDFCRVKKINEKGFGFLRGLYYTSDIFFHFSQIKREEIQDKLGKMKRGDFFLFFISKQNPEGKRAVHKLWYELKDVPTNYLTDFTEVIIDNFSEGIINLFDLLFVFGELKKLNMINSACLDRILKSKKITKLPATILPYLNANELEYFKVILNLESIKEHTEKPYWFDEVYNYVFK